MPGVARTPTSASPMLDRLGTTSAFWSIAGEGLAVSALESLAAFCGLKAARAAVVRCASESPASAGADVRTGHPPYGACRESAKKAETRAAAAPAVNAEAKSRRLVEARPTSAQRELSSPRGKGPEPSADRSAQGRSKLKKARLRPGRGSSTAGGGGSASTRANVARMISRCRRQFSTRSAAAGEDARYVSTSRR